MKTRVIKANSIEELIKTIFDTICTGDSCSCNEEGHIEKKPSNEFYEEVTRQQWINSIIEEIARKKEWKPERVDGWLNGIAELNPSAAFSILLRELAILIDKKYEDHIDNSEKIFSISLLDGRIHEIPKKYVKNYRNFAAFRTLEDAKFACFVLKGQLKCMFSNAKEK